MKNNTERNKKIYYIINVICMLVLIFMVIFPKRETTSTGIKIKNEAPMTPFCDGTVLNQEFYSSKNYDYFTIQFATYQYIYKSGDIDLTVKNEKTGKGKKIKILATSLTDTGATKIDYKLNKNTNYNITIKPKGISCKHKLTMYTTKFDNENYKLTVNNKEKSRNLVITYIKNTHSSFYIWYILLYLALNVIIFPIVFEKGIKKNERINK